MAGTDLRVLKLNIEQPLSNLLCKEFWSCGPDCTEIEKAKKDFSTNIPGIFAGGDVISGGATIVRAVGEGKKAARSMDEFIQGANK